MSADVEVRPVVSWQTLALSGIIIIINNLADNPALPGYLFTQKKKCHYSDLYINMYTCLLEN